MPSIDQIIAKTIEYLAVPSVVGHESFFMNYLEKDFLDLGVNTLKRPQILEVYGNDPQSAILCAHIDRHGLISIGDGEFAYAAQFIREIKYGENNRSSQKELQNIASRFDGEEVFAYDPETCRELARGIIRTKESATRKGDSIFHVEGMENIPQDMPLAYAYTASIHNGLLRGQIDNTLSVAVVHSLFADGFQGTALLTTEEEIGKSWIHIAEYLETEEIETKNLLVIDTSPYKDAAPLDEGMVILRNRDKSETFNPPLTAMLKQRCIEKDIPHQFKDEYLLNKGREVSDLGSTELGRLIQGTDRRWSGTSVQIPTHMYHTSNETTSRKAIQNYFGFLKDILIDDPLKLEILNKPAQA